MSSFSRSGVIHRIVRSAPIVALTWILIALPAEAGVYVDPNTGYRITHEADVPDVVLGLLAKKLDEGRPIFRRSKIYSIRSVGAEALVVRTASQAWLVQTDLKTVEAMTQDVLRVWNNLIVYKTGRVLGTRDRRTMAPLEVHKLPTRGEGEAQWSITGQGSSLDLKMHWVPHAANYAVECVSYLIVPGHKIEHTSEGSFYFRVKADGSIVESSTWGTTLGSIIDALLK